MPLDIYLAFFQYSAILVLLKAYVKMNFNGEYKVRNKVVLIYVQLCVKLHFLSLIFKIFKFDIH